MRLLAHLTNTGFPTCRTYQAVIRDTKIIPFPLRRHNFGRKQYIISQRLGIKGDVDSGPDRSPRFPDHERISQRMVVAVGFCRFLDHETADLAKQLFSPLRGRAISVPGSIVPAGPAAVFSVFKHT
jgi:hypothetical protein